MEITGYIFQSTPSRRTVTPNVRIRFVQTQYFNPHRPEGQWRVLRGILCESIYFNPHRPEGQWPGQSQEKPCACHFNPHRPEGQWLSLFNVFILAGYFNPHRPEGQWLKNWISHKDHTLFQSTPSRRTVTLRLPDHIHEKIISIHTVPKDSDKYGCSWSYVSIISIHTVPKDSDPKGAAWQSGHHISIHTVPKDSDDREFCVGYWQDYFNPHRPEGQWLPSLDTKLSHTHFNPHRPEGQWLMSDPTVPRAEVFQSTPSRRTVTPFSFACFHKVIIFQSTPSRRTVTCTIEVSAAAWIFQSTPSRRTVTFSTIPWRTAIIFQSTPSRRTVTAKPHTIDL